MIKAIIFDFSGTLGYYTGKSEVRAFIGKDHEHLLVTKIADSKLSEERKKQFVDILNKGKIILYSDSEQVIKKLKKNYKVGILSNMYGISAEKLRENFKDFLDSFDVISISSELGFMKPNSKIFIYTLNKLGIKPEEAIMVGNRLDRDIIPAQNLGMSTILIDRDTQTLKELKFENVKPKRKQ